MTPRSRVGMRKAALVVGALVLASASMASVPRTAQAALLPVALPDTYSIKHDRTLTVPPAGVLANDVDLLGGSTATLVGGQPPNGTVDLNANGSFTYEPDTGYAGTDVFRYRPTGVLGVGTTVTIVVANAAPKANKDNYNAVTGQRLTVPAPGVLGNDNDADGDGLTAELTDGGGNGSLSFNANGSFTFTSGGSFTGNRTFHYRVFDGVAWSSPVVVTIDVNAPTATPAPTPPPTPAPTPTPRPTATPIIPLPSVPIPPLPTIRPLPTPILPTIPGSSPIPSIPPTPAIPGTSPLPGASTDPFSTPRPGGIAIGPTQTPGTGAGPTSTQDAFVDQAGQDGSGVIDDMIGVGFAGFDGIEWAVPALVLTVPGLLLLLAVLAQSMGALLWLPVARRWLGGFGLRRKRRSAAHRTG